jgi:hypothetical protein
MGLTKQLGEAMQDAARSAARWASNQQYLTPAGRGDLLICSERIAHIGLVAPDVRLSGHPS